MNQEVLCLCLNRMLQKIKKIGEGVYGEVFHTYNADNIPVALKVNVILS